MQILLEEYIVYFCKYFKKMNIKRAVLKYSDVVQLNLSEIDLTNTIFYSDKPFEDSAENDPPGVIRICPGVDLSGLDLSGCNFSRLKLMNVNFTGANLRGSMFIFTDLRGADFTKADLRDANLDGADFNSQYYEIDRAIICNTIMPDGGIRNYDC